MLQVRGLRLFHLRTLNLIELPMAIYTKKGDRGETSLFSSPQKVSKSSLRIRAIGAVDEANSFLGVVVSENPLVAELKEVQRDLFTIGAILAGAQLRFPKAKTKRLEKRIDEIEGKLPVLKNFILPGGFPSAAKLFFARTLVRRAERALVALNQKEPLRPEVLVYLNRLSDYLFMLAREVNFKIGVSEESWRGSKKGYNELVMVVSPEREGLPIQERPEEFPEIPIEVENKTVVTPTPSQFKGTVLDDQGKPILTPSDGQATTITLPAQPQQLKAGAKGTPDDALTWFAAFWLRMFKKAIHYGWRVITGGENVS